ncbi:MAG: Rrf2 family transcriptional regulator [Patescibacteria group bacterium]|nr:Rrf2 family transcriptional regulator [Patescibacteria group bacterium]
MRVSARVEYACIAMLELASHYGSGEPVRIRSIAEDHEVPPRFLVQILLQLKGAGLVDSVRGAAGGYRLIRPPDEVSLGEVMEVVDPTPVSEDYQSAAKADSPAVRVLVDAWRDVANVQRDMLHATNLSELVERSRARQDQMYHI